MLVRRTPLLRTLAVAGAVVAAMAGAGCSAAAAPSSPAPSRAPASQQVSPAHPGPFVPGLGRPISSWNSPTIGEDGASANEAIFCDLNHRKLPVFSLWGSESVAVGAEIAGPAGACTAQFPVTATQGPGPLIPGVGRQISPWVTAVVGPDGASINEATFCDLNHRKVPVFSVWKIEPIAFGPEISGRAGVC